MKFMIKLLLNGFFAVSLLLWFTDATFWEAAVASAVLSVIAYFVGDQLVLRGSNNAIATIVDAILVIVYFWIVAYFLNWDLSTGELLIITVVLGVIEAIFHRYLASDRKKAAA